MRAEPLQQLPTHMSYAPWQPPQALQAPLLLPNVCEANGCVQVCTCPSLLTDKQSSESCSTGMCTIMPFWMSSQGCATMAQCKAVVPHNLTTMRLLQALSAMLDSLLRKLPAVLINAAPATLTHGGGMGGSENTKAFHTIEMQNCPHLQPKLKHVHASLRKSLLLRNLVDGLSQSLQVS